MSTYEEPPYPLTKLTLWAAYLQNEDGEGYSLEQKDVHHAFNQLGAKNPDRSDLTKAIQQMKNKAEIHLHVDHE